jgi:protein-L-isoaspartate(D-aspartate) O-methyltransferase
LTEYAVTSHVKIQREADIRSAELINALAMVPREHFVGPGPWKLLRPSDHELEYDTTPDDNPVHLYDRVLVALDPTRGL